jgi:hypothetical protein
MVIDLVERDRPDTGSTAVVSLNPAVAATCPEVAANAPASSQEEANRQAAHL